MKKGTGTTAAPAAPFIINTGGNGNGPLKLLLGTLVLVGGAIAGKKVYDRFQKTKGEENIDSPAGAIALQLKNVFESFPVSDQEYAQVKLLVNSSNSDEVYKIYKQITGRNLSDDEAKHINSGTQKTVAKQQAINNVKDGIIKITPDDKIQFVVANGSFITPNPKVPGNIPLYVKPSDIPTGKAVAIIAKSSRKYLVKRTEEVPYSSYKADNTWKRYFKLFPVVRTRQVFAAVGFTTAANPNTILWADARNFITTKGQLTGFGSTINQSHLALI